MVLVYSMPRARRAASPEERLRRAAAAMKVYDPLAIAALGVMVMTGAFALTEFKDALRERFFEQMGVMLTWKLGVTFLLIIVGSYLAFGLGNRLVGRAELDETPPPEWVSSMILRVQITCALVLALCALISWIATAMV